MANIQNTLAIIKPSAVKSKYTGNILYTIEQSEFEIVKIKNIHLTPSQAKAFYIEHKDRPFFDTLVEMMSCGPVYVMILQAENAIIRYRELMGATDPAKASEGTLRKLYGINIDSNAVHGSDSPESAIREIEFFFGSSDNRQ